MQDPETVSPIEALFAKHVKYAERKVSDADEDILTFSRVEVTKELCPEGPGVGKKYLRVDLHLLSGDAVFMLKNGGCIVVVMNPKKGPLYGGEHKAAPVVTADD